MDTSFAAYLERVRLHRAELGESLSTLRTVLDGPDDERWCDRARAALAELRHDLDAHVEVTEAPDGLYDAIREDAARLAGPLAALQGEHPGLIELADVALAALDGEPGRADSIGDRAAVRGQVQALVIQLTHHHERGAELMHEAYAVDLGGDG
ncbi:MAG TPA: hypothetical protein P5181_03090 [Dermatophilaceae bacterium]|nr:hypothetical protein [Dermatophilaceae bacterium]